jgi:ubiquinone/menaquinone biosynthesis C-methylase UbiE
MGFDISSIGYNWEQFARDDPLWSILTADDKKDGRWAIEEFMETGVRDVEVVADRCEELGLRFSGNNALDFGCGVGRLSSALLKYVDQVAGVDISSTMVDIGRRLHAGKPIDFIHNTKDDLGCFSDDSFDLVFTLITLQHMPPKFEEKYILEFLRILKRGGLLAFQLPGRSLTPESVLSPEGSIRRAVARILPGHFLERFRHFKKSVPRMDMFGMPPEKIKSIVNGAGGELVAFDELDPVAEGYPNYRYFITKH